MRIPRHLPRRKSRLRRLRENVGTSVTSTVKKSPVKPSGTAVKSGLLTVGGLTGLTAASAAVSARRHRNEPEG